ncbi:MAG: protein kinase, partial [Phycisphaerales bacterium]|nr:protein kinase [Phycisphaerales bacterium]
QRNSSGAERAGAQRQMTTTNEITGFHLPPGRVIGGKYVVDSFIGGGWEGEVYKVIERRTGIQRAAKLFFPQRNQRDRAVKFYATKLNRLRNCPIVIQYHHSEVLRFKKANVTCLISEFVEGELLTQFLARQPNQRLDTFQALHLLHALALGLEQIHKVREYHGDIHDENILIERKGIDFDIKLVDFYHWGAASAAAIREDVIQLVRVLYDAVGGKEHYRNQPPELKAVCCGLRRDLISKRFPSARQLREYLETFTWTSQ